jgi:deoxyribodipyrimidine photolyase
MIVAFGLFSKQVFWDGTTQALNNLSEILKPDGILVVSVKFDYYEEFEDFIEESELSIDQWYSEYEHVSMQRRMKIEKRFGVKGRGDIRVTYYLKKTEL